MEVETKMEELRTLADQIRAQVQRQGGRRPPERVFFVSLADYFNYNVLKGGFAQLIYNLQGTYLEEMEKMLQNAPAPIAHAHYAKALSECVSNEAMYQAFLAGDFVSPNLLKDALHGITFQYYDADIKFGDEIESFVSEARADVQSWLRTAEG